MMKLMYFSANNFVVECDFKRSSRIFSKSNFLPTKFIEIEVSSTINELQNILRLNADVFNPFGIKRYIAKMLRITESK